MSASLVGSEMCIRDSPARCTGPNGPLRGSEPANVGDLQFRRSMRRRRRGCLLYTSDAADDM
eukprot:14324876-Alexandrium_andersonii.AAC.1